MLFDCLSGAGIDIYKFLPKEWGNSLTKHIIADQYQLVFNNPIDEVHSLGAGSHWGHGIQFSFEVSSTSGPLKLKRASYYHLVPMISEDDSHSVRIWIENLVNRGAYTKCYYLSPQYSEDFAKGGIKVYMNVDESRAWVYSPMIH